MPKRYGKTFKKARKGETTFKRSKAGIFSHHSSAGRKKKR